MKEIIIKTVKLSTIIILVSLVSITILDTFNLIGGKNLFSLKDTALYLYMLYFGFSLFAIQVFFVVLLFVFIIKKGWLQENIISTFLYLFFWYSLHTIIENIYFNGRSINIANNEFIKGLLVLVIVTLLTSIKFRNKFSED